MSRSLHTPSYRENAMMLTNHGHSPLPAFLRAAEKSRSHLLADAAARHTPALDGAVDALLDSGDLSTESAPRPAPAQPAPQAPAPDPHEAIADALAAMSDQSAACFWAGMYRMRPREFARQQEAAIRGVSIVSQARLGQYRHDLANLNAACDLGLDTRRAMDVLAESLGREADPIDRRNREDAEGAAMEGDRFE